MHISVQMTIHIICCFHHTYLCTYDYPYSYRFTSCTPCTNDYFVPNFFPMHFCKTRIVRSQTYLSLMFRFHHMSNALHRVNSVVQLTHYNCYYNVYRFGFFVDINLCVLFYKPMCAFFACLQLFKRLFVRCTACAYEIRLFHVKRLLCMCTNCAL